VIVPAERLARLEQIGKRIRYETGVPDIESMTFIDEREVTGCEIRKARGGRRIIA
jgi:hypothetical protein